MFVPVKLTVLHQHLSLPRSSPSNLLSYTNTYLAHVRPRPTYCPTPTLISPMSAPSNLLALTLILAMFFPVRLTVLHQHSSLPCSSPSNLLSYTNTHLGHVRPRPTYCPTRTFTSAMSAPSNLLTLTLILATFVPVQLTILHICILIIPFTFL
jgi:hypothetical protein